MRGILVLGVVIIILILIGVLFYYEDTHVVIQAYAQSVTLINELPGNFVVKINLVVKNNGLLPMGLTITSVLGVVNSSSISSLLTQPPQQYVNITSINVGPLSEKVTTLSYTLPPNFIIRYFYVEASGYYNFVYTNTSNMQLIKKINDLVQRITSLQILKGQYFVGGNLTLISNPKPPYLYIVQPYTITIFNNNSYVISFYAIFYPYNLKINSGNYRIQVFVNNISVYNTNISIPYQYNELLIPIGETPVLSQNSNYTENVYILFNGSTATYYIEFKLIL